MAAHAVMASKNPAQKHTSNHMAHGDHALLPSGRNLSVRPLCSAIIPFPASLISEMLRLHHDAWLKSKGKVCSTLLLRENQRNRDRRISAPQAQNGTSLPTVAAQPVRIV